MDILKETLKTFIYPIWWRVRYQYPWKIEFQMERLHKSKNSTYQKLREMKDKYKGERCFVVGTGPSLSLSDLDLIKKEYSASVNSILLSFSDTKWRPTFYAIQDITAYERLKDSIESSELPYIFCGVSTKKLTPPIKRSHISYQLDTLDHANRGLKFTYKFSDDAYDRVYDGFSITYAVLQLVVYMGFTDIILLGVDCDYTKEINHIKEYAKQTDDNAGYKMYEAYKYARMWADENGIRIINATRNTKMDAFECLELEKILNL